MKLQISLFLVLSFTIAAFALAGDNTPSRSVIPPKAACAFGSCFVPNFDAVGEVAEYEGPGAAGPVRFEYADCCTDGDRWAVQISGAGSQASAQFLGVAPLNGDCSLGPYADSQAAEVRGASRVKVKAKALPGGIPASAYIRMSQADWVQTVGTDSCF